MSYGNSDIRYPIKLIKGLISPPDVQFTTVQSGRLFFKFLVEFWGFCINGTNDLQIPGGFAVISGTTLPTNFLSGSGTLMAVGDDGQTTFGDNVFSSNQTNFLSFGTGSLINRYLVTWKPNDSSPDDSIYRIIGVDDANHIRVDVATGGTTRRGAKAYFSTRDSIKYRIFDPNKVVALSGWTTSGLLSQSVIMNFDDAPNVNSGQLVSQLKLDLTSSQSQVRMTISPSGSWNGSIFADAATPVSQSWFSGGTSGRGYYYFMAGRDFIIFHMHGEDNAWSTAALGPGFHVEVPQRLYPYENDPNPMMWFMWQNSVAASGLSPTTGSYANGIKMVCHDGVTREWTTIVRTPVPIGDHVHYNVTPSNGGIWYGLSKGNEQLLGRSHFNSFNNTYMSSDAMLMQTGSIVNQQHSFARVRLRRVRFTGRNLAPYTRLGEKWVHIGGGIMWPWDGSQVPYGLFWDGGGAITGGEVEG